jgi:hypothetical protein
MQKEVILIFPDLHSLWRFAQAIHPSLFELNTTNCSLSCLCDEQEITLAIIQYKARVGTGLKEKNGNKSGI